MVHCFKTQISFFLGLSFNSRCFCQVVARKKKVQELKTKMDRPKAIFIRLRNHFLGSFHISFPNKAHCDSQVQDQIIDPLHIWQDLFFSYFKFSFSPVLTSSISFYSERQQGRCSVMEVVFMHQGRVQDCATALGKYIKKSQLAFAFEKPIIT